MRMDKIIKHKSAYIKSFEDAIVGNELNVSYPNVNSSSPYHAELNEEQEISAFAYNLGKTIKDNLKVGDNGDSGNGGTSTSHNHDDRYSLKNHNHDDIYAKITHNHDNRYYTKVQIDEWRDRLINGDLLFNKINSNHIQAGTIVAGSTIIANGAIGDAQIDSLSASKLDAGVVDTSKVTISGANGNLKLRGNRLQVFEGIGTSQFERVALGDVNNDGSIYGLRVRGRDGQTILYDENGVYREGITDGSINNDKIAGDANIDGGKLNIHSVITNINENNTGTIHGTKIDIDGESVTSKIFNIELNQDEQSETIERQQSEIDQNREQIKLKVGNQKYTEDMASMTSKLEKAESDIEILNEGIKLTASKTEVQNQINNLKDFVSSEIGDISIGGANYLNNSAPRKATIWDLPQWDITINGKHRLTYWEDYNDSVELPQVGYHPHIDLETFHFPCIAFINRNAKFSMANRELSLRHEIHKAEEVIVPNETYVISFDAYSDTSLFKFHGGLYHKNVESNSYNYHSGRMDITISQENVGTWQRRSYTFTTHKGIDTSEPIYLVINGHNNPEGSGYIKNIKLERSNIVSQWTPSQFDVDDSLDDVVNNMKEYTNESIKDYSASVDVKFDGITTKVNATESGLNGVKGSVSEISQKADSLTTRVTDLNGKYTQLKQTVDSIELTGVVKFNDLSTLGGTTIHGGNIKSNSLSINSLSSNNPNPIIKLFPTTASDGTKGYCSIDATKKDEQGIGDAIRFKWDSMNYILQKRSSVDFFMEPREVGNAFGFQSDYGYHTNNYESRIVTKEGTLCFRRSNNDNASTSSLYFYTGSNNYDRKLLTSYDLTSSVTSSNSSLVATAYGVKQAYDKAVSAYNLANHSHPYASTSHSHSNYASSSHSHNGDSWEYLYLNKGYINYLYYVNGSTTDWCVLSTAHLAPNTTNRYLGQSAYSRRWQSAFLVSSPNVSSDATLKENIEYLDDNSKARRKGLLTANQLHEFIKNDLRIAEYDYKVDSNSLNECCEDEQKLIRSMNNHQIGFIAQDIVDTEVGSKIVTKDSDGILGYETGNFMSVIAGALQEEIKRRETLEERVRELEELVNKLLEKGDE